MIPVAHNAVWESEPFIVREQVYMNSGSLATSTDVSSASVFVYDKAAVSDPLAALYSAALTVSATVIPAASLGWSRDSTGYNVSTTVASTAFTRQGGHTYRVELSLSTVADGIHQVVQDFRVDGLGST